jgi:hypothetical protein
MASEKDLTPDELAAAARDMEGVLNAEPRLNDYGFGVHDDPSKTPDELMTMFQKYRDDIREPCSLAQFMAARGWLRQFPKTKQLNKRAGSYSLKHVAEHDIGYVTNGVFIAAAIAEGFMVRRIWRWDDTDNPNAWFNISRTAWRAVEPVYANPPGARRVRVRP